MYIIYIIYIIIYPPFLNKPTGIVTSQATSHKQIIQILPKSLSVSFHILSPPFITSFTSSCHPLPPVAKAAGPKPLLRLLLIADTFLQT